MLYKENSIVRMFGQHLICPCPNGFRKPGENSQKKGGQAQVPYDLFAVTAPPSICSYIRLFYTSSENYLRQINKA